jgi:diguanylate cyclase (GGDEF)-like protein
MQTLRDLSLIDDLTGLYNRRGFFAVCGKRAEVARRVGCSAFLAFADLDDLKQVNDEFGHSAGDTYVQLGAEAMRQSFRAADVLARVGGDEFVALGLEVTSFDPQLLGDRIERTLDRLAIEHRLRHPVGVSCGVERFRPEPTSIEEAMDRADAAMYRVKRARKVTPRAATSAAPESAR